MPNDHESLAKLTKCVKACNADPACMKSCQDSFIAEGGKVDIVTEGGKVFTDPTGGKVFITNGGKVF